MSGNATVLVRGDGVWLGTGSSGSSGASGVTFPSSVVAAYDFDANTGTSVADTSGHGHTGTFVTSKIGWASGHTNSAASGVAASGGYISIPRAAALEPASAITVGCWVKLSSSVTSGDHFAVSKEMASTTSYTLYMRASTTGNVTWEITTSTGMTHVANRDISDDEWHHIAGTYDGTTMILYVDGVAFDSAAKTGDIVYDTSIPLTLLGSAIYVGLESAEGAIDDVYIHNVALDAAGIAEMMATPATQSSGSSPASGFTVETYMRDRGAWSETETNIEGIVAADHGSSLTSSNTGASGSTFTTWTATDGGEFITQAWLDTYNGGSNVFENILFDNAPSNAGFAIASGAADITGQKITFRNCKFIGLGGTNGTVWVNTAIVDNPAPSGFVVEYDHCTFDGNGQITGQAETAIIGGGWTMNRCYFTDLSGIYRGTFDNITVTETFFDRLAEVPVEENPNPHTSCIGFNSGSNITVQRCKMFPGTGENLGNSGAIVMYGRQNNGLNDNVKILDNALQGGAYALYAGSSGTGIISNCVFTGNIFYRDDFRYSGAYGPVTSYDSEGGSNTWSNNTWGPTGLSQAGDPAEGATVPPQ